MASMSPPGNVTRISVTAKSAQIRVARRSPAYWRVTIDNPPINVMGPEMVKQFQEVINALEADEQVRVVVFDSAVDDYFLNHSDFTAKIEDLVFELKSQYTIVIVTHNMQQAARVAEKTGFFLMGQLVEFDATQKIFTTPSDKRTEDYITGRFG